MKNSELEPSEKYPYCSDDLETLAKRDWILLTLSVLIAVACLIGIPQISSGRVEQAVAILLFTAIPFVTLVLVSQDKGSSLFRQFRFRTIFQILGFGVLTFVLAIIAALVLSQFIETAPNPGLHNLHNLSSGEKITFFLFSIPQLFGEEVITIIPFIGIIYLCTHYFHLTQKRAVVIALLLSCIWFSLIHLPTYDWNLVQVLGGVGVARFVLTLAFIITRNLWVSFGAHVLNDWIMFALSMIKSSAS